MLIALSVYLPLRHTRKIFEPVPNGNTLGRRNYDFSPDGIDVSHEHFSSQYQWSSIVDFVESDNYFFLFIDSTAAFIIPKRAFETAEELASFEKLVIETSGLQVNTID